MKIEDILQKDLLFAGKKNLIYEPLNGGLSNETFKVIDEDIPYVVKIHFPQNEYLRLSRSTELQAQNRAAKLQMAPRVYSDLHNETYTIAEYVQGDCMSREEVVQEETIKKLAKIIRKIHSFEGIERRCSAFDLIDQYLKGAEKFQVKKPDGLDEILHSYEQIRNRRSLDRVHSNKYCHNDVLTCNLITDGERITVLDWELSGVGDPYMDLATLPYQLGLSKESETLLLTEYFGYYEEEMYLTLQDLKYVGMVREVAWALFYAGLNKKSVNHDFAYYEAAQHALNQLKKGMNHF